jgi:chemosensory pili system protein ChpA (sensor histidine kinase/response regulator)
MSDAQNYTTLKWIRDELNSSLEATRRSLEDYVDEAGGKELIEECVLQLHQIHGTLQMVQVYGAAMMAEEMEQVAIALRDDAISQRDEAAEALMLGLIQLPEYLEKLENGGRDEPILILPLLNELRASRDSALLSEVALFAPALEHRLASERPSGDPNPDLQSFAREIRHKYHRALLDWYRETDTAGGLERIAEIFSQFEAKAGTDQVKRLFRVGQAAVAALGEGSIDTGVATKLLVGKIDRDIKRISRDGEWAAAEKPANDLLRNLLYYTARAQSALPLVAEVKRTFDLDRSLVSQAEIEEGRDGLAAPSRDLLESLRSAISADLTAIKDGLDLFIRSTERQLGRLKELEEPMRKLADTLGMVGQGRLRQRLKFQADKIAEMVADERAPEDADLMSMAGDILYIESSLENLSMPRRHGQLREKVGLEGLPDLPDGEFERLIDSVMHEAGVDMAKNKEAITTYIDHPENRQLLSQVPGRFKSIAGVFRILHLDDTAGLIDQLSEYVSSHLLDRDEVPANDTMNAFADAVTSIEYYMEAISEGRGIQSDILEVARESLNRLGFTRQPELEDESGSDDESVPAELVEGGEESVLAEADQLRAEAPVLAQEIPEPMRSADKPPLENIDPEILEIFIEEAREELAVIKEYLPRWRADQDDRDSLITFRRSFHTLKGSGRLVGASTIGELAWSVENLLNRVIDETIPITHKVHELLDEVLAVIPVLIDCQESGEPVDIDVDSIMGCAFELADPASYKETIEEDSEAVEELQADTFDEDLEVSGAEETGTVETSDGIPRENEESAALSGAEVFPFPGGSETQEERVPVVESDGMEATPAISMDETLFEIFEGESRTHITTLKSFIDDCRGDPLACRVGEQISRALHTLHGSAHMAEVEPIAEVSAALEAYVLHLQEHGQRANDDVLQLFERGVSVFEQTLDAINRPEAHLPEWIDLESEIRAAVSGLMTPPRGVGDGEDEFAAQDDGIVLDEAEDEESIEILAPDDGIELVELDESDLPGEELDEGASSESGVILEESEEPEEIEAMALGSEPDEQESDQSLVSEDQSKEPETAPTDQDKIPVQTHEAASEPAGVELVDIEADPELLDIFLEEARELLDSLEHSLQAWDRAPESGEPVAELERTLHTLKGGARLAGAMPIGDLSHAFESLLTGVDHARIEATPGVLSLAHRVVDRLADQLDDLVHGPRVRDSLDLVDEIEQVFTVDQQIGVEPEAAAEDEQVSLPAADEAEAEPDIEAAAQESSSGVVQFPGAQDRTEAPRPTPVLSTTTEEARALQAPPRTQREKVRVRSDLLDRLVNNAGEVSIYRARIEQQNADLGFNLSELEQTVDRLREQLRQLDIETEAQILFRYEQDREEQGLEESFDPLELDRFSTMQQLSRSLIETVNDLVNINGFLFDLQRENETLLLQQSRLNTDLQDGLMRTRMVPFAQIVPRLHRVVRQTCNPLGKKAGLDVEGASGELDRGILDRMIGPLEHILRNAVSHGIERPEQRLEAGKSEEGRISLMLRREGTDVLITISDDGAGIRTDAIRKRAIEKGMLDPHADITDNDLLQFVLEHGFSTVDEITQIAGRGVGLDVVVSEVKQLGGSLDIQSEPGKGTSFIVRLPLTLAISDALLVDLGEEIYAIPHTSIEGVVRMPRQDLEAFYNNEQQDYSYAGRDYQVRYLGSLLNLGQANLGDLRKWYPLLLVRAGEHRVALQVDNLLGNRQIVVKSVGPQLSTVRWISGGTILGDGRVALILDVTALVRLDVAHTAVMHEEPELVGESPEIGFGSTVMVVDDSITVRKVTGRLLERHGMQVITAKDGVDAVAMLQEHHPDVMLLDIEMPRMDGYELARHMRNSDELNDIPIIMITSRTGDKHRNLAMELGVKRYLGKPYQEGDLLDNIYSVLSETRQ